MATAGDGASPNQSGGAGGKFGREKPIWRRSAQATPYDRPPTALRIIRVFRKLLPSTIAAPPPPAEESGEEAEARSDKGGSMSEISFSEGNGSSTMLKHKTSTFSRCEKEHLRALLHEKSAKSDVGDHEERGSPSTHLLRLEYASASTASICSNHLHHHHHHHVLEERDKENNIHAAAMKTPVVTSRAYEEEDVTPPHEQVAESQKIDKEESRYQHHLAITKKVQKKKLVRFNFSTASNNNMTTTQKMTDIGAAATTVFPTTTIRNPPPPPFLFSGLKPNTATATPSTFATLSPFPPSTTSTANSFFPKPPSSPAAPTFQSIFTTSGGTPHNPTPAVPSFSSVSDNFCFLFGPPPTNFGVAATTSETTKSGCAFAFTSTSTPAPSPPPAAALFGQQPSPSGGCFRDQRRFRSKLLVRVKKLSH